VANRRSLVQPPVVVGRVGLQRGEAMSGSTNRPSRSASDMANVGSISVPIHMYMLSEMWT